MLAFTDNACMPGYMYGCMQKRPCVCIHVIYNNVFFLQIYYIICIYTMEWQVRICSHARMYAWVDASMHFGMSLYKQYSMYDALCTYLWVDVCLDVGTSICSYAAMLHVGI